MTKKQRQYIEKLYSEMWKRLYTYAYSVLKSKECAEEAVQETARIACDKPDEVMSSENPQGWVMNTLKLHIRNERRKRKTMEKYIAAAEAEDINQFICYDDHFDLMYSDMISPEEFQLLKWVYVEKYTIIWASEKLGISVEACKKRVQRTSDKLREKVEKFLSLNCDIPTYRDRKEEKQKCLDSRATTGISQHTIT